MLERAGDEALTHFQPGVRVDYKGDESPVTAADRRSEAILVETLMRVFPKHGIVGEEGALHGGDGPTWYLDPVDGTSAFVEGLANWGVTVCLMDEGELVAGALWVPILRQFWFAMRGEGAWRDGVPLRVAAAGAMPASREVLYVPSGFHHHPPLDWSGKTRSLGSTAIHLAQVASGSAVAALVGTWKLWDVGCGALLVTEAGGRCLNIDGESFLPGAPTGAPFLAGTVAATRYLSAPGRLRPPAPSALRRN